MSLERGIDLFQNFRMTKIVLRHGFVPHKDSLHKRFACKAQCESQFFFCKFEQILFIPWNILTGASDEDADQGISLRGTMRELCGCTCAGEGTAPFAARDDVSVTANPTPQIT